MKAIRTKTPITIGDRIKRQSIVAIAITEWTYQENTRRWKFNVTDFEVTDAVNPQPGEPLKNYIPIVTKPVFRTEAEINGLFNYFGIPFEIGDDFSAKMRDLVVKGLMFDTTSSPIYDIQSDNLEMIDTDDEIVPFETL